MTWKKKTGWNIGAFYKTRFEVQISVVRNELMKQIAH